MAAEQVTKLAFLEELHNIYQSRGWDTGELSKLANARLDEMIKEAKFLQALRGMGQRVTQKVSPTARLAGALEREGMGDVVQQAQRQQGIAGMGRRIQAAGKQMAMTPAERVTAAGLKMAPGEAAEITRAAEQMGRGGAGQRMVGGALEGVGHHVAHKGKRALLNPIGVPLGGALEGLSRQGGKELVRTTGLAGEVGAGGLRGSIGRGLQQHAGRVGQAGELGGLAALGTVAHAPLSSAGALGTAALKGLGIKGALAGALGSVGAHGAADVVGMGIQRGMAVAPTVAQRTVGLV